MKFRIANAIHKIYAGGNKRKDQPMYMWSLRYPGITVWYARIILPSDI